MGNEWFESVAEAERRAEKRLPRSVHLAIRAGSARGVTLADNRVVLALVADRVPKQRLLQAPDTASRVRDELTLLRAETAILLSLPSLPAADLTRGPTSLN